MGSRATEDSRLRDVTATQAVPTVALVAPKRATNDAGLELPGRLQAYISAPRCRQVLKNALIAPSELRRTMIDEPPAS